MNINEMTDMVSGMISEHDLDVSFSVEQFRGYYNITEAMDTLPTCEVSGRSNIYNLLPHVKLASEHCNEYRLRSAEIYRNVYSYIVISPEDHIIARIMVDGKIIFYHRIMTAIEEYNLGILKETINKILIFTDKVRKSYLSHDHDFSVNETIKCLLGRLYLSRNVDPKNLKRTIGGILEDIFDETDLCTGLLAQNSIYRKSIQTLMTATKCREEALVNKGILLGSKLFNAIGRAGYTYNGTSRYWEKSTNIIPEYCIKNGEMYHIPEQQRVWRIPGLKISTGGLTNNLEIRTTNDTTHPNVSDGFIVCTGGNIKHRFHQLINGGDAPIQDYANVLLDVEKAMKIINFDSSFHQIGHYRVKVSNLEKSKTHKIKNVNKTSMRRV